MTTATNDTFNSSPSPKQNHSPLEDFFAYFCGGLLVALGILLFNKVGIITGGVAGLALITTKVIPVSFGLAFFFINLPFFILAWMRMGKRFTLNSLFSVTLVSVFSDYLYLFVEVSDITPLFAAIMGGFLIGMGMLAFFRHRSSIGGLGILAIYVQDVFKLPAGRFLMIVDAAILVLAFTVMTPHLVLLSILGAAFLNVMIMLNHKPGRYQIT
ncbi:YitT family protein [Thalassotalea agarivorans]|uniref:Uncharacterized 5xTM membrane BCR, YitT family COG1284 n=1 Tax=Thalassotalea agarivorans TaxID=349064 RepID=A0A1I0I4V1_THASX|nr:YitT family protein [Thalassotalea agarivorans]SET91660.1 Uncharacterised 5xTM membrane BCR, YitT family COG1284 [Thalassotalea agarivorans]